MLRLLLAGFVGAGATLVVASQGTFVYSAFQHQIPFRTALKVTPDPANVWSWHGTLPGPGSTPMVVDIDGNGRNDTENPLVRVLVTDVQVYSSSRGGRLSISDGNTVLWRVAAATGGNDYVAAANLMTPIPCRWGRHSQ